MTECNRARFEHLLPALALAAGVPGDYMELGVWRGDTFLPLARHAAERSCQAHAVDSFVGMLPPTAQDVDEHGCQQYPAGALSVGGPERLRELTAGLPNVRIHAGFIPEILRLVQVPAGLAFVHLDLDQHLPTRLALAWVWRHLNAGGVVACHDYWPGRGCLASRAIDEFLLTQGIAILGRDPKSSHAWFSKGSPPVIPKLIHFIWIGGPMPGWAERNLDEFRRLNPGHEVRIHGAEALLECYREHYAAAGELCSKADLLRYSVLERYGGWYFDCDYWPFRPVADAQRAWGLDGRTVFVAECWTSRSNPGWLGNGMLASVPGHHVWAEVRAAVAAVKVGTTDRLAFGPTLIRGVLERDPAAFTLASEPWFNGVKAPTSTKLYRHIRRTGDSAFARAVLPRTGGQLPFAMHLWAWKHGEALDGPVPSQALGVVGHDNRRSAAVVTMPNGKATDKGSVFTAVASGLAGLGFRVEVLPYEARALDRCGEIPEVVVLWNGMREQGAAILAQARQFGSTVLRLEYGFFDRARHFQVDHEGILHWASWRRQLRAPAPAAGAERLARFCPAGLAGSGPRSGYVLVLGQVPGDTQVRDSELQGPVPLQEAIARNLPRGMNVPVYFRPHPSVSNPAPNPHHRLLPRLPDQPDERQTYRGTMQSGSLEAALSGALFAVTINSNAAVEALAAGVPVLAFGPHLGIGAGVIRRTTQATFARDFEAMLAGWRPDPAAVRNFLEWLAARQWSREELSRPETLRPLLEAAGVRLAEAAPVTSELRVAV